jgi:hypothetical protein
MTDFDDPIPSTVEAWRHCIEHHCGIPLTPEFAAERIRALENPHHEHTRKFIECYGKAHHQRVLGWFRQVAADGDR